MKALITNFLGPRAPFKLLELVLLEDPAAPFPFPPLNPDEVEKEDDDDDDGIFMNDLVDPPEFCKDLELFISDNFL